MLLLLVHQSQFVTIMAPPSGDNIKGFPLSLSDSKMATRCRPLGPIQIYLQTATDRTAGGSVPRLYIHYTKKLSYWLVNC